MLYRVLHERLEGHAGEGGRSEIIRHLELHGQPAAKPRLLNRRVLADGPEFPPQRVDVVLRGPEGVPGPKRLALGATVRPR